jgi:hypothetical protein
MTATLVSNTESRASMEAALRPGDAWKVPPEAPAAESPRMSDDGSLRLDKLDPKDYNEVRNAQEADKKENGPEFLRDDNGKPRSKSKAQRAIDRLTAKHYQALSRAEAAERRIAELESAANGNGAAPETDSTQSNDGLATASGDALADRESGPEVSPSESNVRAFTPAENLEYKAAAQRIPNFDRIIKAADNIGISEELGAALSASVPAGDTPAVIAILASNPAILQDFESTPELAPQKVAQLLRDMKARTSQQAQTPSASPEFLRLQSRLSAHNQAVAAALRSAPDLSAAASDLKIAHHVTRAVLETDNSHEVVIHLARNPKELDELNRLNPVQAAAKIGRISERLEATKNAPPKSKLRPPDPISTVGASSAAVSVPLDKLPPREYINIRNQQEYRRKRGR